MSQLQVSARFTIHAGKLDEFKQVAARCMQSVREKDTGTLQYDWFFNPDQTQFVVRETYRDSDAVFEHIANLGDNFAALLAVADMEIEAFGTPSASLLEATTWMSPRIYAPFLSI